MRSSSDLPRAGGADAQAVRAHAVLRGLLEVELDRRAVGADPDRHPQRRSRRPRPAQPRGLERLRMPMPSRSGRPTFVRSGEIPPAPAPGLAGTGRAAGPVHRPRRRTPRRAARSTPVMPPGVPRAPDRTTNRTAAGSARRASPRDPAGGPGDETGGGGSPIRSTVTPGRSAHSPGSSGTASSTISTWGRLAPVASDPRPMRSDCSQPRTSSTESATIRRDRRRHRGGDAGRAAAT